MLDHVRGKRSAVTCALKCDNACLGEVCNTSANSYFRDIAAGAISRRSALGLGLAGALTLAFTGGKAEAAGQRLAPGAKAVNSQLDFTPIKPVNKLVDEFTVPSGYSWQPIIRWGDPLFSDSPEFDVMDQTAEAQARQFGYNNDYTDILRIDGDNGHRAVLFTNHEYTNEDIMFPAAQLAGEKARVRAVARAAHGLSVVELTRRDKNSAWSYVKGAPRNRRFLLNTEYELTGPAAGSALVKTVADPTGRKVRGTLGNCAGGTTPWGTILSGEENFNGYFRSAGRSAAQKRYGLQDRATGRGWELDDPRFDTRNAGYENEENRFGWVIEVDPMDPTSTPKKHTSLGRFKHEGANVRIAANGKVVAYSGDDERFDYLYKFVSKNTYRDGGTPADRAHNMTLLSEGNLYVAKFTGHSPAAEIDGTGKLPSDGAFDGAGEWLPLVVDGTSAIAGMSVEEVLVYTRLAADKAGATKMDRCEDVEPHPTTGKVYVVCTNNSKRGEGSNAPADEANPRRQNRDGHIVEITEDGGDQTATTFGWNLLLVCGDPAKNQSTYFAGYPTDQVSPISCPDNVAFDSSGYMWLATDGAPSAIGYNDGLFKVTLEGPERGRVEQFLAVPRDAETCGPIVHDEERHVYVAVQHPGEEGSFEAPNSLFPDYVAQGTAPAAGQVRAPRPSIIQVLPSVHAK
ncbi:PhoX family protein [Sinomonas notoginsengisoli]|uniref:PhoX family protein n=1 Tax=Sinomonas notoginsengisoli TaxID=1457311 RepID=UPI001F2C648A|nr:PhoX family phosphatase [Sinomonas notoginsengisoli]